MVKRSEFEQALISIVYPAITKAQDELSKRYGVKFEVVFDWKLTQGKFEDSQRTGIGG